MGHHHHHDHHHGTSNIRVAFFLNLGFTIVEIIGGIYTGSLAILSDALHDLGDSFSIGLSWYFQKLSHRSSDIKYSYGYRRFSVLGALINAVILLVGSVFILYQAIPALFAPSQVNEKGMLIIAIFGVIVNGAAVLRLKKGNSLNEKVISLHLLEDVLGWLAVLIGSLMIIFFEWHTIDPILSVLISLFIIFNVFKNLKSAISIIMQSTPDGVNVSDIKNSVESLAEVKEMHDCHAWTMDGTYNVLSAHVVLTQELSLEEAAGLKERIKSMLKNSNIHHSTLEFESPDENCEEC